MIGTYASAALICAVSLLVGRALLSLAGRREWSWLEPAVGLAAVLTVTGALARAPGHGTSATIGVVLLIVVAALVAWRLPYRAPGVWRTGLPVAIVILLALAIPFAVSGRWGLLGVGFNNDLGLHLAWAEWLRSGFGPAPDPGYPLGPHGLAVATAAVPGIGLGQAFVGEIVAIGVLTGLTALGALRELAPGRRVLAAAMVALPYLAASYFAQAAFKETAEALFVLAFAIFLCEPGRPDGGRLGAAALRPAAARPPRRHLLLLQLRRHRLAGRDRGALEPDPAAGAAGAAAARAAALPDPPGDAADDRRAGRARRAGHRRAARIRRQLQQSRRQQHLRPGLPGRGAGDLADLELPPRRGRRRPPDRPRRGDRGAGAAGRRRLVGAPQRADDPDRARRLRRPLPRLPPLQRRLLPGQGPDDRRPPGDARRDPPAADRAAAEPRPTGRRRPYRRTLRPVGPAVWSGGAGWVGCAGGGVYRGSVYSSFLALRDAPVGPAGHGAELEAFLPVVHGQPVLYAGQDRYAAYDLLGRRHPRAAGRVPRRRSLAQPGEAVRHRRRLQPDRLRLLHQGDARPLQVRDHRPRRLEQPGAAQLQADRRDPLLPALGTDRADPRKPPRPARGDRGGGARLLRLAGGPHPARQPRPRLALPRRRDRPQSRLGARAAMLGTGAQTSQS